MEDLKTLLEIGFVVKLRTGEYGMVMPSTHGVVIAVPSNPDIMLGNYDKNLFNIGVMNFDMMEIYGYAPKDVFSLNPATARRALVWQREEKVELSKLSPGDAFKIGEHDFIVLEQMAGQTLVISKGFMAENKPFDNKTRDYNNSSLKKLIESDIQPVIENAIGTDNIVEHNVDLTAVDMQNQFGTCRCKVRPITFDEARKYNDLLVNKKVDDWWWTCTPWSTEERGWPASIAVVSSSGIIYYYGCNCSNGVRPLCILKSNIFVSKHDSI